MKDKSLIPNSQIETMFMRIASDEQMQKYIEFIERDLVFLASAYASNTVFRKFFQLVEEDEKRVK